MFLHKIVENLWLLLIIYLWILIIVFYTCLIPVPYHVMLSQSLFMQQNLKGFARNLRKACSPGIHFGRSKLGNIAIPLQKFSITIIRHKRSGHFCKSFILPPAAPMWCLCSWPPQSCVASSTNHSTPQESFSVRALVLWKWWKSAFPAFWFELGGILKII